MIELYNRDFRQVLFRFLSDYSPEATDGKERGSHTSN